MSIYPSSKSDATGKPEDFRDAAKNPQQPNSSRRRDKSTDRPKPWDSKLLPKWRFILDRAIPLHLSGSELACLIHIVDQYNGARGYAWPSFTKLAALTGYCRTAVKQAVAELVRRGIIAKESGWTGRANRYTIDIYGDQVTTGDRVTTGDPHQVTTGDPHPATRGDPYPSYLPRSSCVGEEEPAAGGDPSRCSGPLPTASGASPVSSFEAEFEAWWHAYPRHEGKPRARKEFARVRTGGVSLETLVAKAEQYARAYEHKPERQKWPATWLQEEGWLDDPQPPRPKAERKSKANGKDKPAAKANTPEAIKARIIKAYPIGTTVRFKGGEGDERLKDYGLKIGEHGKVVDHDELDDDYWCPMIRWDSDLPYEAEHGKGFGDLLVSPEFLIIVRAAQ
jgi:hypothetical protein